MSAAKTQDSRTLGLMAATGVGVGAIVGGGILALAGVAFETTGPSTILAFLFNGGIALITAISFAELASRFPESGGTYTYARKVLTVEAAFAVGWIVWFASVVAAVLYALGFAVFLVPFLQQLFGVVGADAPTWIGGRFALLAYALAALGFYTRSLMRSSAGGDQWATIGKLVVFTVLIGGGLVVLLLNPPSLADVGTRMTPFFEHGASGLAQAMGYTFIALQGFDLIAAVGGNVKQPERNIPRAMIFSLGIGLLVYIPFLILIVLVGTDGQPVAALAAEDPEILVARAAGTFMGPTGYWLVVVAGVLSMLSAMQANLMAASSFAGTMAVDRTLPVRFDGLAADGRTPLSAIRVTAGTIALVLVAVPDVAAAGAVSSLIFLVTFALAHGIAYLARRRSVEPSPFRAPLFPLFPALGGGACVTLALYQAAAVPSAGVLAALWLSCGAILYVTVLAPRARVVDASTEGHEPHIVRLRGRSPLVLVPVANPAKAPVLVKMAEAIAPRGVSRVQLLSVVRMSEDDPDALPGRIIDAQKILGGALSAAISVDLRPEALITIARDPWGEITRIAERTDCDHILLGVGGLGRSLMDGPLESLIGKVEADVVVLRAPNDWDPDHARRILVPARGGRAHSPIRARLVGNLCREHPREVTYLSVLPTDADASDIRRAEFDLKRLARDEARSSGAAVVVQRDDIVAEVVERAKECDLMILGLSGSDRRKRVFGQWAAKIAEATTCPLLMISQES
jgi:amino acid transporter/nucleotide-binding universal stress UspA family protein